MGGDNLANNHEPDTGSLFLSRHKRLEGIDVQGDAGAGIAELNEDSIVSRTRFDGYLSTMGHGLGSIFEQVE